MVYQSLDVSYFEVPSFGIQYSIHFVALVDMEASQRSYGKFVIIFELRA